MSTKPLVTDEELFPHIAGAYFTGGPESGPRAVAKKIAALVAERTAAAVAAARAEEREACVAAIKHVNATVKTQEHYEGACMALEAIRARKESQEERRHQDHSHGEGAVSKTTPDRETGPASGTQSVARPVGGAELEVWDRKTTPADLHRAEAVAAAIATRLRAREARVQALVEAVERAHGLCERDFWTEAQTVLRAALDALEEKP